VGREGADHEGCLAEDGMEDGGLCDGEEGLSVWSVA
jgi:hypothetical protein